MNEERFVSEGYELLIRLPGRTRVPRNWMVITEGCEQRSTSTQHGMMLSVRSPLEAEIERVFDALLKQPWAGEIADTWSRKYKVLEVLTPRESRKLGTGAVQVLMPFHLARGIVVTEQMVSEALRPTAEPLLLTADGLLRCEDDGA